MIVGIGKASDFLEGNCVKKACTPKVGKWLKIISMKGEPQYNGKKGIIEFIDDAGQIHGTWGGCAVIPDEYSFMLADSEEQLY